MKQEKSFMVSTLVENFAGVLSQIIRLFSRKGYNIQSVAVDTTEDPTQTRITILAFGDELAAKLILSQLQKQVPVIAAKLLDPADCVVRGLVMIKVAADTKEIRDEVIQIVNVFRANIVDINQGNLTVAVTGATEKLEAFIRLMEPFGILELVRSGTVALERGENTILTEDEGE